MSFFSTTKVVVLRSLGAAALLSIFIVSAFAAMRLAIHGREVTVPSLANLSDQDAEAAAKRLGLHLSVENRFYAPSVPVNHVLSQSPAPGSRVRRGWQVRVSESLGSQQVPVPDVTGQDEHAAGLMLRRLQLEPALIARIAAPGPAGVVLAQSPSPNVASLDGPRVALLVADRETPPANISFIMPSLVGMTFSAAQSRLATVGLHLAGPAAAVAPELIPDPSKAAQAPAPTSTETPPATAPAATPPPASPLPSSATPALETPADPAIPPTIVPATPRPNSIITSQSPQPGRRVSRADTIHVNLAN